MLVNYEGLAIRSLLKIQSDPLGNLGDTSGDEMNLHMPQDPESEAELKNLAAVPYQIVSPANNASIIGIYQDSMLGSYQFTREGIRLNPREAMNLLMMFNGVNEIALLDELKKDLFLGRIGFFNSLFQYDRIWGNGKKYSRWYLYQWCRGLYT